MNDVRTWESDDRDLEQTTELYCFRGGNGDFYIGSRKTGHNNFENGVRICLSGGTIAANPELAKAVSDVYKALEKNSEQL